MEANRHRGLRISVIGAGNVATHLAKAFHTSGAEIATVAARTIESARMLATQTGARAVTVNDSDADVDFIIIAVSDKAVAEIAPLIPHSRAIVMHTSGSVPLEVLTSNGLNGGVLYPLQTFSRDVPVNLSEVPFFTEAINPEVLAQIDILARTISDHIYHADSVKRRSLHVAGVLTSNFPVYLLEVAQRVLEKAGFPLDVVKPLAEATLHKAFAIGPHDALTGPARRGDIEVTRLQALSLEGNDRIIYETITNAILDHYIH